MTTDKGLPEHMRPETAEAGLVGCVLRDADATMDDVLRLVRGAEDFSSYALGVTFEACRDLYRSGNPVAVSSVYLHLVNGGRAADLGPNPAAWLADLVTDAGAGASAAYFAGQVREASARRHLWHVALQFVAESVAAPTGPASEMAAAWERAVRDAVDSAVASPDPPVLPELVRDALDEIDSRRDGSPSLGVATGMADLDAILGGMRPGQLVVVGARPGVGKTSLALAFLAHAVRVSRVPAYLASLEMPSAEIVQRLLAMATGVALHRITRGRVSDHDAVRLAGTLSPDVYGEAQLFVDDSPHVTTAALHARVRRMVRRRGVRLLAVDYLQLMTPSDPRESRVNQVGRMSRELKLIARDCGVPVLLLSQLNRESEARGDGRPKLSDLRDSGAIEQDADAVILLHPVPGQEESAEIQQVTAFVAKNRNGPTGDVPLAYRRSVVRFENSAA